MNDVFVEGVFEKPLSVGLTVKSPGIRLIVAEQQLRLVGAIQHVVSKFSVLCHNCAALTERQFRLWCVWFPRPGVAKPELRQQMNRCFLWPAIVDGHPHEQIFRRGFGVFHKYIKVAHSHPLAG